MKTQLYSEFAHLRHLEGKQESEENLIIRNSSIGMESARTYTSVSTDAFSCSRSVNEISAKDFMEELNGLYQNVHEKKCDNDGDVEKSENKGGTDTLSDNAEGSLEYLKGKFSEISTSKAAATSKRDEDLKSAIRYMLLNWLLMMILGKNGGYDVNSGLEEENNIIGGEDPRGSVKFMKVTDTISCERYESEFEGTTFNASGKVITSDGREIDFGIDLTMSRSFEKYTKETGVYEQIGMKLCDPLVLNFDTGAADISDQKFYFDLDSDGKEDEISKLGSGSGFLALDLNEDGEINDGSELFGTKSGDGFKDLSKYDKDGNGWIDEADDVFDKLKVYCFNEDGTTSLYSLKDKGVGAIYLGNTETEFSVKNQENRLNAQVRKTGIFLYETGMASTIQHVDLAVELGA